MLLILRRDLAATLHWFRFSILINREATKSNEKAACFMTMKSQRYHITVARFQRKIVAVVSCGTRHRLEQVSRRRREASCCRYTRCKISGHNYGSDAVTMKNCQLIVSHIIRKQLYCFHIRQDISTEKPALFMRRHKHTVNHKFLGFHYSRQQCNLILPQGSNQTSFIIIFTSVGFYSNARTKYA